MRRKILVSVAAIAITLGMGQTPASAAEKPVKVSFENVMSGMCADVHGVNQNNGAEVVQWTCNGLANQKFAIEKRGDDTYALKVDFNGKCLEIGGYATTDNSPAVMWDCHYGPNQLWRIERTLDGTGFALRNAHSNKCLDNGGVKDLAKRLVQYQCFQAMHQIWK